MFFVCFFSFCLVFFLVYRPTREFFTHMETLPLQILTYARHSRPLSSEGSLACQTYCDKGHPFIMVISEDPWVSPIAERLALKLSLPVLSRPVIEPRSPNTDQHQVTRGSTWEARSPQLKTVTKTPTPGSAKPTKLLQCWNGDPLDVTSTLRSGS